MTPHGLLNGCTSEPWAIASLVLLEGAERLGADPPSAPEVKRWLRPSTAVQRLVKHFAAAAGGDLREGCRRAAMLGAWSMGQEFKPDSWGQIADRRVALEAEMGRTKRQKRSAPPGELAAAIAKDLEGIL